MMKSNALFTKRRPRVWSARFIQAARCGRLPSLLTALALALLLGLRAAPAAYAFPAEEPPACTVVGWGGNVFGQATPPAGLGDVVAIAAGEAHSLALKSDGTVIGWGDNGLGQATPPTGLSDVVAIAAGYRHSLALKSDGTVIGWGDNGLGQATPPAGLSDVVAIAGGQVHSLALKSDGTVVAWGENGLNGQPPAGLNDAVAVSAGGIHSLALKSDGTVVAWGGNFVGQATVPAGLADVVAVSAGDSHSLALKSDGTVVAWGLNSSSQTTVPASLNDVVAISAGNAHSLALKSDGTVVAWGYNVDGQATVPAGLSNVVAIAAGRFHSLALQCTAPSNNPPTIALDDASVTVQQGQTATNTGTVSDPDGNFVTLSASIGTVIDNGDGTWSWSDTSERAGGQVVTITADDGNGGVSETTFIVYVTSPAACAVVGWGDNVYGQAMAPAGLSDVVAISAGVAHSLALKGDGTVVVWGDNSSGQLNIPAGLSDVVAIAAGGHSLALKADGTVVAWGNNDYGQATAPTGLNNVVAVDGGLFYSLALKADGTVVVWGLEDTGVLAPPVGLSDVVAIAAGYPPPGLGHILALKADGTVVGWGLDNLGQATPPAGLNNVVAIVAGAFHSLALKADGTVVGWGNSFGAGAETAPAGLSDVTVIAAGVLHSLALKADGTVVAWGNNDYGQATTPAGLNGVVAIAAGFGYSLAATTQCLPSNTAPMAADDSYSTNEDTSLTVPASGVLGNDSDAEGNPLTAQPLTSPAHGSLLLNADGSFTYTPDADFNGADSFTYVTNDGMVNSTAATVNITVNAVNDAPAAMGDSYSTDEDTPLTVAAPGVLGNDNDVEGNPLTAVVVADPANGSVTLNTDGSFTYTPNANFNGSDSFTYKANDGGAPEPDSNVATVNITVNAVNDAPLAVDDSYTTDEDVTLDVPFPGVLSNDIDVEGDHLNAWIVSGPAHGSLVLAGNGSFSYTPDANFNGSDSFTYQVNDGMADSNVATVSLTVNAVNDAPVAAADSYLTDEDVPLTVPAPGVQDNDSDVDGDALTSVVVDSPAHGSVSLNADGSFTYTPGQDYNGSDSFTYKLNDGAADSNVATVTIVIGGINDAPVAADDSYAPDEDTPLSVPAPGVLGNDGDVDNDPLTIALVDAPAHGSLTLNPDDSFSYTPGANFDGSDSFTYQLSDGQANSNIATVTIIVNAVNDAPLATNDSYSTNEDVPLSVPAPGVLSNDGDVDGNALSAVLIVGSGPTNGVLTLNPDGSFSYTPNANYNGSDSFTYKANDGQVDSNIATVSLTIVAVNDPPVAGNDSYTANEDTPLSVAAPGVLANDSDPVEGSPVTAVLVSDPAHGTLTLNADGSFSYTPAANYSGTDSFTYKANDGGADSNIATVSITVVSASSLIDTLIAKVQALVNNGVLDAGNGNALISKLDNAKKKLMSGQPAVAINMMQAFINQVNAFSGSQLTPAQAQELITDANAIIAALN